MYEAYRARRRFQWRGWEYATPGQCECSKEANMVEVMGADGKPHQQSGNVCLELGCTGIVGSGCTACFHDRCRCSCNIPPWRYAGDIWIVEAGHPRKDMILSQRMAVPDVTLPPGDELAQEAQFKRLLNHPTSPEASVKRKSVKSA